MPATASAHAVFLSAQPAPDARLAGSPPSVRIVFSEPLNAPLSGIRLFDSHGAAVPLTSAGVDATDGRAYVIRFGPLQPDRYAVLWHTVSLVDGHARQGSYEFTVLLPGGAEPAAGQATVQPVLPHELPGAVPVAGLWAALGGLFLLAAWVLAGLLGQLPVDTAEQRSRLSGAFGAVLLCGIALLTMASIVQLLAIWLPAGGWGAAGPVLGSRFGAWWMTRMATAGLLAAIATVAWKQPGRVRALALLSAPLTVIVAVTFAATSHPAASAHPSWGTVLDTIHLVAASTWIGGVIAIALLLFLAASEKERELRKRTLRRFSFVAGIAVPVVLISGVGNGLLELARLSDLWDTAYGRTLLIKAGVVVGLLFVAAANAFLLNPAFQAGRAGGKQLRLTVAAEALLGLAVLIPVAVLSTQNPSRPHDQAAALARQYATNENPSNQFVANTTLAGQAADFTLTPGTLGLNVAEVEITGTPSAASLALVASDANGHSVHTSLPRTGSTLEQGLTHTIYQGTINLAGRQGTWRAQLTLPDAQPATASVIVPLSSAPGIGAAGLAGGPAVSWLVVVLLAMGGSAVLAASRAVHPGPRRLGALSAGGAQLLAAVGVAIVVALPAPARTTAPAWGVLSQVTPYAGAHFRAWPFPAPDVGAMLPAPAPDGSVWVSEMTTNKLARFMPGANTVQEYSFAPTYQGTMGTAVDASGDVWLAQEETSSIGRFDPVTGHYQQFHTPTANASPTDLAFDQQGKLWFTELGAAAVGRYDPVTNTFKEFHVATANATPYAIAIAPDGTVWFTDLEGGKVDSLNPATGAIREYTTPNNEHPSGIAVGPDGTVWAGTLHSQLLRIDPSTGATKAIKLASQPYGLAFAPNGQLWAGTTGDQVYAVDPTNNSVRAYTLPHGSGPWWPTIAANGDVWVVMGTAQGNGIARISP